MDTTSHTAPSGRQAPNILVIMSDDQGYGDLGCMGADDLETPHLDRLAEHGALLTDFYSNTARLLALESSVDDGPVPGQRRCP